MVNCDRYGRIEKLAQLFGDEVNSLNNELWGGSVPFPSSLKDHQPNIDPRRLQVVNIALSQVGQSDGRKYFDSTVDPKDDPGGNVFWCGIFALWVLHQAGLALNWKWEFGEGFLSKLKQTKTPLPGDLGYLDALNHHFIVERIDGDIIYTIDGNSTNGMVARNHRPINNVRAYYSIESLL